MTEGEENQTTRLSAQREQLTEEGRKAGRLLMKRKKVQGQEWIFEKHLERSDFCDFDKPYKRTREKGKIEFSQQNKVVGLLK